MKTPEEGGGGRSDRDQALADEHKAKMRPHLDALAKLQDDARRDGFITNWQYGQDPGGRYFLMNLTLVKHF